MGGEGVGLGMEFTMPGILSLRGQGQFYFSKGTSIAKPKSIWETFEGHQGKDQDQGQGRSAIVWILDLLLTF